MSLSSAFATPRTVALRPPEKKYRAAVRHSLARGAPFCGAPVRPNIMNIPKSANMKKLRVGGQK